MTSAAIPVRAVEDAVVVFRVGVEAAAMTSYIYTEISIKGKLKAQKAKVSGFTFKP